MNKKREPNIHKCLRPYGTYEEGNDWITPLGEYNIIHQDCPTDEEICQRVEEAIKEILKEATEKSDCPLCETMKNQAYNIVYYCSNWCHKCKKAKRCKNFDSHSKEKENLFNQEVERFLAMSDEEIEQELDLWMNSDGRRD